MSYPKQEYMDPKYDQRYSNPGFQQESQNQPSAPPAYGFVVPPPPIRMQPNNLRGMLKIYDIDIARLSFGI